MSAGQHLAAAGIEPPEPSVTVTYEGRAVPARPGTTIAAALTAAGITALRHAPGGDRGVFCGMGVCGECVVTVDGRPGRLACLTAVHDGMELTRQPITPQARLDAAPPDAGTEQLLTPELLVVGAGPAGLAAALAAAESGVEVLVVDERAAPGGQYYKQPAATFAVDPARLDAQYVAGRALIARVAQSGATVLSGVRVWGAAGAHELYAARDTQRWVIRPQRLLLATGAYERAVPFPGWTLPGVLTSGAGQSLLRSYQVAPGQRVLIAGNGPLNVQLAAELTRAGGTVVGLVELARFASPRHAAHLVRMGLSAPGLVRDGAGYLATLRRARVPILSGCAVIRVEGSERAERAVVARVGADGTPVAGSEQSFEVDAVCVGYGFLPGNDLARLLGARHRTDPRTGGYVVERDAAGRTSVADVWVVGDTAEVRGAKVAEAAGALAGADVATSLGRAPRDVRGAARRRRRHERFQRALWRIYGGPALFGQLAEPQTIVCRCESVPLAAIDAALEDTGSAGALKRLTRVGMGRCQGRFCGFVVADRVAAVSGAPVDGFAGFAPQPPTRPTAVGVLAAGEEVSPPPPG